MTTQALYPQRYDWTARHLCALIGANIALACGPWFVRVADCGPVAAGFWRLVLPLPILALFAAWNRQPMTGFRPRQWLAIGAAGLVFGLDLASWHIGIGMTRLGNATLFGNSASLIVMAWGVMAMRRQPTRFESGAMVAAIAGSAILMGRSLEIGRETLAGDLFSLLAGLFYAIYILVLQNARERIGTWPLLVWASLAGAPALLAIAVARGEPVLPGSWWAPIGLALCSQVVGQGLLVYAMRHVPPLLLGLALMTQPAIAVAIGWTAFGETLVPFDLLGMALIGTAMVLAGIRRERN